MAEEAPQADLSREDERAWDLGLRHVFRPEADEEPPPEPETGPYFGRYRVFDEIGRGGIGVIFHARDEDLDRDVAVKVLRDGYTDDEGMIRRFLTEAQICGQLQHPGVVPVYEMGMTPGGRPFFSMKLIQGRTLAALLEDRQEPREERGRFLGIFHQVCQTLAYAHDRRIVHRDLKPSNVMVGAFGEVQVLDWGFAKMLASRDWTEDTRGADAVKSMRGGSSLSGSVIGTPSYMPPEQARGNVAALDERADVFALGAMLCQILSGEPPYHRTSGEPVESAAAASLERAHAALEGCDAGEELVQLALRCLRPAREDRPRNAGVVATAIADYLAGIERRQQEARMAAAEARGRAAQERKSHRLALAVTLLLLSSVVLGGGILWVLDASRREGRDRTDREVRASLAEGAVHVVRGSWEAAERSLRHARRLVSSGEAGVEAAAEVQRFGTRLEEARAENELDARAQAALRSFARLHVLEDPPEVWGSACERTFRALGVRPEELDETAVTEALAAYATTVRRAAALTLDDWACRRRSAGSGGWRALLRAARLVDPHPWRVLLRNTLLAEDGDTLLVMAQRIDPAERAADSLLLLGIALARLGHREQAVHVLEDAWPAHPGHPGLSRQLAALAAGGVRAGAFGLELVETGGVHLDRALRHARVAVAVDPGSVLARELHATLLERAGRRSEAVDCLRAAVRLDPLAADLRLHLARQLHAGGDDAGALREISAALGAPPDDPRVRATLDRLR